MQFPSLFTHYDYDDDYADDDADDGDDNDDADDNADVCWSWLMPGNATLLTNSGF